MAVGLLTRGMIGGLGARTVIIDPVVGIEATYEDPEAVLAEYERSAVTSDQMDSEIISTDDKSPVVVIEDDDVIIKSGC